MLDIYISVSSSCVGDHQTADLKWKRQNHAIWHIKIPLECSILYLVAIDSKIYSILIILQSAILSKLTVITLRKGGEGMGAILKIGEKCCPHNKCWIKQDNSCFSRLRVTIISCLRLFGQISYSDACDLVQSFERMESFSFLVNASFLFPNHKTKRSTFSDEYLELIRSIRNAMCN